METKHTGKGSYLKNMSAEQLREFARKGGKAAHEQGTAHEWTPEEAADAGSKGGSAPHRRRGRHSSNEAKQ